MKRGIPGLLVLLLPALLLAAPDRDRTPRGMVPLDEQEMAHALIPLEETRRRFEQRHRQLDAYQRLLLEDEEFRQLLYLRHTAAVPPQLTPYQQQVVDIIRELLWGPPVPPPPEP